MDSPPQFQSISAIAIRRHIGTLMLTLTVVVVGVLLLFQLQVDLLPQITYPRIGVNISAPGVSPDVVIEEITKPLEKVFNQTEGVTQIFSRTREGRARIELYFAPGEDIEQALEDTTVVFNRARGGLSSLVENVNIFKFDPAEQPVYEFALRSSSLELSQLRTIAEEELSRELSLVPGVASVDVAGGAAAEITVDVDLQRLQSVGLGFNQVVSAIERRNRDFAGGNLVGEAGEPLTRTVGKFQSLEQLRNLSLVVGSGEGQGTIYLRDVAEINDSSQEQKVFVSLNGEEAIKISIQKQPDANTVALVDGIKRTLITLKQRGIIGPQSEIVATQDESRFIRSSIRNVVNAGLLGTLLAAVVVLLFIGSLRQTLIIAIAIPLATGAAVVMMKLLGLSINIFSLGGLAIGVGIVVDNSIVMLETITSNANPDDSNFLAQAQGAAQSVESALIAATITNLASVLPFLLLGGTFALLFGELILTVSLAIAASLLLALTLVPMLASRLLTIKRTSGIGNSRWWRWFSGRILGLTGAYARGLEFCLAWRWWVVILAFTTLGSSYTLARHLPQEVLPKINTGQAILWAKFPAQVSLAENRRVMAALDQIILDQPQSQYVFTTAGGFIFGSTTIAHPLRGNSTITLNPGSDIKTFIRNTKREIEKLYLVDTPIPLYAQKVRGINISNSPVANNADLDIILQGANREQLINTGRKLLDQLGQKVDLAEFRSNLDPPQSEVQVVPDWERIAAIGLSSEEIGRTIRTAIAGSVATQLQQGSQSIDVRVQLPPAARQTVEQLRQLPLVVNNRQSVFLGDIATIVFGKAPSEVERLDGREVYVIAGNLVNLEPSNNGKFVPKASLNDAMAQVERVLQEFDLPPGISVLPSFALQSQQQLRGALWLFGSLAVFLVFVVMAVQYNSLIDPLVIIMTVPLALAGGIWGLYLTQTAVGATVLVGAVLLVGIVVNNAIVMVELANQLHFNHRLNRQSAIVRAAAGRLRPILMTTLTTVLGMFPLALGIGEGSELLQPLGVVVFSGLALSTVLTLVVIPCVYVIMHELFAGKIFFR